MVPEGIEARVEYKGALADILTPVMNSIRQEMSEMGESAITDLSKNRHIARDITGIDYEEALSKTESKYTIPTF